MCYRFLKRIDLFIEKFALYFLVISLFAMLGLTIFNIVMRWVSYTTLWVDPLIRHMVFLAAFMGGVLSTGHRQHIGIDILSKYLESFKSKRLLKLQQMVLSLISAIVLMYASYLSIDFVQSTFEYEGIIFLGIHSGVLVSIIPLGFFLIAFRFVVVFMEDFISSKD